MTSGIAVRSLVLRFSAIASVRFASCFGALQK